MNDDYFTKLDEQLSALTVRGRPPRSLGAVATVDRAARRTIAALALVVLLAALLVIEFPGIGQRQRAARATARTALTARRRGRRGRRGQRTALASLANGPAAMSSTPDDSREQPEEEAAAVDHRTGGDARDRGRAGVPDPGVPDQAVQDPEPVDGADPPARPARARVAAEHESGRRPDHRVPSAGGRRLRRTEPGVRRSIPGLQRRGQPPIRSRATSRPRASRARRSSSASSASAATC